MPEQAQFSYKKMIKQLIWLLFMGLMVPCAAQTDLEVEHFNCDSSTTGKHEFSVLMYSPTASGLLRSAGGYHTADGIRYFPQQTFYHGLLYTNRVEFDGSPADPQKAVSDYFVSFPDATIVFSGYVCEDFVSRITQNILIKDKGCCTHGEPYDLPKPRQDDTGVPFQRTDLGSAWGVSSKDTITIKGVIHHAPVIPETDRKTKRKRKFVREK